MWAHGAVVHHHPGGLEQHTTGLGLTIQHAAPHTRGVSCEVSQYRCMCNQACTQTASTGQAVPPWHWPPHASAPSALPLPGLACPAPLLAHSLPAHPLVPLAQSSRRWVRTLHTPTVPRSHCSAVACVPSAPHAVFPKNHVPRPHLQAPHAFDLRLPDEHGMAWHGIGPSMA